jgi:GNAT superfamily N-acetyltransferase
MSLRLQKVGTQDMPVMYALLVLCGEHMHRTLGLSHWYPFRPYEVFQQHVDENRLYAIYSDQHLAGTFTLTEMPRPYYQIEMWAQPDAKALYFGLFGVLPAFQGEGVGRWAMQQMDTLVQAEGFTAVRFDAIEHYPPLLRFYDRLGYTRRGLLPVSQIDARFKDLECYERVFE